MQGITYKGVRYKIGDNVKYRRQNPQSYRGDLYGTIVEIKDANNIRVRKQYTSDIKTITVKDIEYKEE